MMKAYIAVSFSHRKLMDNEITAIRETLQAFTITPFVFVDCYNFNASQEEAMMKQAMLDIDSSDILIAEISQKAIGVGVEVGYAKAKGRKIIYLRKSDAEHSTTIAGISDFKIVYANTNDLQKQLGGILNDIDQEK